MRYFITGSSRGIGLGLTEALLKNGHEVIAAARNLTEAGELQALSRDYAKPLQLVKLDTTHEADLEKLALSSQEWGPLDVLINNAGVYPDKNERIERMTAAELRTAFEVNVIGTLRTTQALLPALQKTKHPKIFQMSSMMGSIEDNSSGGSYAYRISKAALNMLNKCMSIDLPEAICIVLHPGWVKTRMGGANAMITVNESVEGLIKVMDRAKAADTGKFFSYQGKELPW